jgi:hypothetical protein
MAATPVPGKRAGAGGVIVVLVILAALALSKSHIHINTGASGQRPAQVAARPSVGPDDPCRGRRPRHQVMRWPLAKPSAVFLPCSQWWHILERHPAAGVKASDILRCITAAIERGTLQDSGDPRGGIEYRWRWGESSADIAKVVVSIQNPGLLVTAVNSRVEGKWIDCAKAAA